MIENTMLVDVCGDLKNHDRKVYEVYPRTRQLISWGRFHSFFLSKISKGLRMKNKSPITMKYKIKFLEARLKQMERQIKKARGLK